jgi:hypothetical protein
MEKIAGWERLGAIWRAITITRNDLAHCGKRETMMMHSHWKNDSADPDQSPSFLGDTQAHHSR